MAPSQGGATGGGHHRTGPHITPAGFLPAGPLGWCFTPNVIKQAHPCTRRWYPVDRPPEPWDPQLASQGRRAVLRLGFPTDSTQRSSLQSPHTYRWAQAAPDITSCHLPSALTSPIPGPGKSSAPIAQLQPPLIRPPLPLSVSSAPLPSPSRPRLHGASVPCLPLHPRKRHPAALRWARGR